MYSLAACSCPRLAVPFIRQEREVEKAYGLDQVNLSEGKRKCIGNYTALPAAGWFPASLQATTSAQTNFLHIFFITEHDVILFWKEVPLFLCNNPNNWFKCVVKDMQILFFTSA